MILIIDDDSAVRSSLSFMLKRAGYEAQTVSGPREAMEVVRSVAPDLILMDMNFTLSTTGEEGLTLLRQVKIFRPETPVILMTAWGSIQLAVQGMQAGAFDFITKPWNNAALLQRIETALELAGSPKETTQEQNDAFDRRHIIGRSQGLTEVLNTIARIAKTNASVLITGESGTGKELIAEAIHINSQRAKQPFVKVNLGGISQSLFESEMFGHKKGAFTDASSDRIGRFEMANKGTIFLDEIGDLDAPEALDVEALELGSEDLRGVRAALAVGVVEVIAHEFEPTLGDAHEPAGIVAGELVAHLLVILEALVGLVEDFLKHILLAQPVIVIDQLFDQILGGELRLLDDHVAAGHPAEAAPVAGALVDDEHVLHMLPGRQCGPRTRKAAADDQHVRIENNRFRAHG